MTKKAPCYLSIEKAVARMINFDYIPEGFSLLDMTDAFREDAEVAYENAQRDPISSEELDRLRDRLDACNARHTLAMSLLERLEKESQDSDAELDFDRSSDGSPRVSLASLSTWAVDNFGIGFAFEELTGTSQEHWEDVTIKIYVDYRLGWRVGAGSFSRSSFGKAGLLDNRNLGPNRLGGILIGLAMGEKFPPGSIQKKDKTAIARLRDALQRLTQISADPFRRYNRADGWVPRFKLIDDRLNADERAKARAHHEPFDDTRDYQAEDDDAGNWLEQNK